MAVSRYLPRDREEALALLRKEIAEMIDVQDAVRLANKVSKAVSEGIITYEDFNELNDYAARIVDELNRIYDKTVENKDPIVEEVKEMVNRAGFDFEDFYYSVDDGKYTPYVRFAIEERFSAPIPISEEEIANKYRELGIEEQPLKKVRHLIAEAVFYEKFAQKYPAIKEKFAKYIEMMRDEVIKIRDMVRLDEVS